MHSALAANRRGSLNRENVVFRVGNAFMRSETSVNIRSSANGTVFRLLAGAFRSIVPFNVPPQNRYQAERINPFPTKHLYNFQFITDIIP